jgi:hypothetical protein
MNFRARARLGHLPDGVPKKWKTGLKRARFRNGKSKAGIKSGMIHAEITNIL